MTSHHTPPCPGQRERAPNECAPLVKTEYAEGPNVAGNSASDADTPSVAIVVHAAVAPVVTEACVTDLPTVVRIAMPDIVRTDAMVSGGIQ